MQQLSPKKYIETKARMLPLYKCLVNRDWEQSGMASVVVLRQHVNGNVTGADFLVDLKCLGVKNVHWFFNEDEPGMMEKLHRDGMMEPVDYELAHNIVYAGYEFALEYGIQPDKEFAMARFILEEDTDEIPIVDIETGENGIPHLIEYHPGQYADALAKLKKNAGEGNYRYTVASPHKRNEEEDDDAYEEDEYEEEDEEDEDVSLHDIPNGSLTLHLAKRLPFPELVDKALIETRLDTDRIICDLELQIRFYTNLVNNDYEEPSFIEKEWMELSDDPIYSDGLDDSNYDPGFRQFIAMNDELAHNENELQLHGAIMNKHLQQNKENVLFLALTYEVVIFQQTTVNRELLKEYLQPFTHLPMIQLLQAMESVVHNQDTGKWQDIIEATNIQDALPNIGQPGNEELIFFWGLQMIRHLRSGNLPLALDYYNLYSSVDNALSHTYLFFFILQELLPKVAAAVETVAQKLRAEKSDSLS